MKCLFAGDIYNKRIQFLCFTVSDKLPSGMKDSNAFAMTRQRFARWVIKTLQNSKTPLRSDNQLDTIIFFHAFSQNTNTRTMANSAPLVLNSSAVTRLAQDNYDAAMEDIRSALGQTRSVTDGLLPTAHDTESTDRLHVAPVATDPYRRVLESGDIIFGQGFTAHIHNPSSQKLSDHDTCLLTVILLFNLALSYHLRGISAESPSRSMDQEKALSVYHHAMELSVNHLNIADPTVALVLVAIGNNMCSISAGLSKFRDLHVTLEWTYLQCTDIAQNVPFFWLNVMFWKSLGMSPAAAA